jgi:hypothetical protein
MSKNLTPARGELPLNNLERLTSALLRGLHLPVRLQGDKALGFVVRLDDGPFGPVAVVHVPDGAFVRVLYRDPEEVEVIAPSGGNIRIP